MKILPLLWAALVHAKFDIPDFEFREEVAVEGLANDPTKFIEDYGKSIHDDSPNVDSYLIENEPGYEGAFAMDEIRVVNGKRQGRIYPTIKFDREEKDIFILTIKSVDARGNVLESKEVHAIITDENDNTPVFKNTPLTVNLVESPATQVGDVLGTIVAEDNDDPKYTSLGYEFIVESQRKGITMEVYKRDGTQVPEYFGDVKKLPVKLNYATGEITLSRNGEKYADAETYEKLVIYYVQVRDQKQGGKAALKAQEHLTIQIRDINDNAPIFDSNDKFIYKINEDTPINQPIENVAFDGTTDDDVTDENSMVGYKIEGGGSQMFGFDNEGHFVLKKPLDYETKSEHVINLVAFNPNGDPEDPKTARDLKIVVGDVNEAPVFERFIDVKPPPMENDATIIGSKVGKVKFNDDGAEMSYSMDDESGFFRIDKHTGEVYVASTIDREWACVNNNGQFDGNKGHPVTVIATDKCSIGQLDDDPTCTAKSTEQQIWIQVGNEDDNKAMVLWSSGSEEKAEICKNQNFKNRFTIVDCDGDVVTVDHNQKDLVEIAQDEDGYYLRVLDGDKVSNGVPLMITLVLESSFQGSSFTRDVPVTLDVCGCDDDGSNQSCAVGVTDALIPWWLFLLIAVIVLALIGVIVFATVRRNRQQGSEYDPLTVNNGGDIVKGVGQDSNGSEYPGQYDGTMTLPYQKGAKPDWAGSKPDGELADIIKSFKETADQEDTVPNGLLTFEFEGRNSMISDLSSLHSYGSERSLNLDNLPEQVKKQFR